MPSFFYKLGDLKPDLGRFGERESLQRGRNIIPYGDKYSSPPIPDICATVTLTSQSASSDCVLGAHVHSVGLGSYSYFLGSNKNLFVNDSLAPSGTPYLEITAPSSLSNISKSANAYTAFSSPYAWQFTSFGNNVFATNGIDPIQVRVNNTGNFADSNQTGAPTSADPKAYFITTVKNHVVIANITMGSGFGSISSGANPYLVWISATDNGRRFGSLVDTPTLLGTDFQQLYDDYGHITGLIGGEYAYIFKERAIYLMEGPPWSFTPISTGVGCLYPNSIIKHFDDLYFWSEAGPAVLKRGSGVVQPLGYGSFHASLLSFPDDNEGITHNGIGFEGATPEAKKWALGGFADEKYGIIGWRYHGNLLEQTHNDTANLGGATTIFYNVEQENIGFQDERIFDGAITDHVSIVDSAMPFVKAAPETGGGARPILGHLILAGIRMKVFDDDLMAEAKGYVATWGLSAKNINDRDVSVSTRFIEPPDGQSAWRITCITPIMYLSGGIDNTTQDSTTFTPTISFDIERLNFPSLSQANIPSSTASTLQADGKYPVTKDVYSKYKRITMNIVNESDDGSFGNGNFLTNEEYHGFVVEYELLGGTASSKNTTVYPLN